MPRVLLIGRGPLPSPALQMVGFAQLRTQHFFDALREAGCDVDLLTIEDDLQPGLLADARARAARCDAVVSAGPHRPGALAVACAGDRPLWVDIPGDPLAELQALARAPGPPLPRERVAAAQAATHAVLARADAISVISHRQRYATFGRLSGIGRDLHTPVAVTTIPIAWHLPFDRLPPRPVPETGPIRLALSGAFTPWLDDERLAAALSLVFDQNARVELHVTGGAVAGHYTAGWERFARWAAGQGDRVRLHGWVPHDALPGILSQCHIGLCLDRPGAEPELGGRTRTLLYLWLGLQVAASPTCEQVSHMRDMGLAQAIDGRPADIAKVLLDTLTSPRCPPDPHPLMESAYGPKTITRALTEWAKAPAASAGSHTRTPESELAAEVESLREQLSAVHSSPTWRALSGVHRLIGGKST